MDKVLEIHSDVIYGTGSLKKDYSDLKFTSVSGYKTEDPRHWIKEFRRDVNFKSFTVFALRVERTGIMFMVWTQTSKVGERDGDGSYAYLYVPSDLNISGRDICRVLFETKKLFETLSFSDSKGKLPTEFEKAVNEKLWTNQHLVSISTSDRDEEKYGYVYYETEQQLIEILDYRHQKAFGTYRWVALSDKKKEDFIKTGKNVDDITSIVRQRYILWDPTKFKRGDWSPVLRNANGIISPNTYIYSDEAIRLQWNYKDGKYKYDGDTRVAFEDLSSNANWDRYFSSSKILIPKPIKVYGEAVHHSDLVYHYKHVKKSVEIVDKKYCVYLPESETIILDDLELTNDGYTLQKKGDGVVISKKRPIHSIYCGDVPLCRIDENGYFYNLSNNDPKVINKQSNVIKYVFKPNDFVYFLKRKWWVMLIVFVVGMLAGFFIKDKIWTPKDVEGVVDSTQFRIPEEEKSNNDSVKNTDTSGTGEKQEMQQGNNTATNTNETEQKAKGDGTTTKKGINRTLIVKKNGVTIDTIIIDGKGKLFAGINSINIGNENEIKIKLKGGEDAISCSVIIEGGKIKENKIDGNIHKLTIGDFGKTENTITLTLK